MIDPYVPIVDFGPTFIESFEPGPFERLVLRLDRDRLRHRVQELEKTLADRGAVHIKNMESIASTAKTRIDNLESNLRHVRKDYDEVVTEAVKLRRENATLKVDVAALSTKLAKTSMLLGSAMVDLVDARAGTTPSNN